MTVWHAIEKTKKNVKVLKFDVSETIATLSTLHLLFFD